MIVYKKSTFHERRNRTLEMSVVLIASGTCELLASQFLAINSFEDVFLTVGEPSFEVSNAESYLNGFECFRI